tara:strand:- start:32 stop:427 length:396 start_codon:yes stop_codon:yes gene_type:complete
MPKKPSRKYLVKKLDKIFSIYIRLRDSDENGFCKCISCGKKSFWRDVDAGHFVGRRHLITRFDPKNVYAQCRYCNRYLGGHQYPYSVALEKLEKGLPDKLFKKSKKTIKLSTNDLILLINKYKKRTEKLDK